MSTRTLYTKISREDLRDWLWNLGLDPDDVYHIEITPDFLSIQILAFNSEGQPYMLDGDLVTHQYTVEIIDRVDQHEQV